ncbi:MAG TPA: ArsA-related P-loop ATPase [Acidimicrobiales bacterium]|nr:ArsA-related P-loop ATPase [Acidimicrobiales bacterium]
MADLLDRKLVFVTGKGGVGKTTIAAALAWLAADRGKRTLVCEIDAKGDLASFYETGPIRFEEREVAPRLWAMSMDTEASLKQYLSLQLKIPLVAKVGPLAKMFDFVASAAPGVREIVTVGKLCWEVRERHYDLVVVDASASGHIVSQLAAPQAINQLVQVGLVRQQTGWMLEILGDPATTGLVVVATPAEMPVSETLDLTARVRRETNVDLAAVVVNRVLPELFGRGEEEVFEQIAAGTDKASRHVLEERLGGSVTPLLDAARLTVTMRRGRTEHLERLREAIDPGIPMLYMPYLFFRNHGLRATHQIADALSAELGY